MTILRYKTIFRKGIDLVPFLLLWFLFPTAKTIAQCKSQTTLVPLPAMKAASKARDFARFKFSLSASDSLYVRSHEDDETSIGPYDIGLEITRNGRILQRTLLRNVPEIRHEEPEYAESFRTLAISRACSGAEPIHFVTLQYRGDITSPALLFVLAPNTGGYLISTLPLISGGVFEISKSNPLQVRTWDNLHEGICEACETHYEVTAYEIRNGKPIKGKQYRTKRLYTSADFGDRTRIRFMP